MLEEVLHQDGVEIQNSLSVFISWWYWSWTMDRQSFPFLYKLYEDVDLAKDELIYLKTKILLQLEFNSESLGGFWCSLKEAYPRLVNWAVEASIPFANRDFQRL
jgi:hypothetical protein